MSDNNKVSSSAYMSKRRDEAKASLLRVVDEYKALLKDSVHPDEQRAAYKKRLQKTYEKLIYAANELDMAEADPGAGIFSLLMLSLRSNFYLKDELVKMKKEMKDLKLEIKRLKK